LCFSQTNALETGSEQGFGIDEEVARHRFGRPGQCGTRYRRAARELEKGCQPIALQTSDT
jgi:hypothetical protein